MNATMQRLRPRPTNRRGFAHGGLLVTLADIALGKTYERQSMPRVRLSTTSLVFDFVDIARRGEWIEAHSDFQRTGRAFVHRLDLCRPLGAYGFAPGAGAASVKPITNFSRPSPASTAMSVPLR
jgi:hypothetical protein